MTHEEFARRVVEMQDTLYHVSATLLRRECDREDAVQEAIATALTKLTALREERAFPAWIIRILINECYTMLRRKKREILLETLPEQANTQAEEESLYDLFLKLEERYRLPMVLHYVEGYSLQEVAQILRRPEGTIKTQLLRGRRILKTLRDEEEK